MNRIVLRLMTAATTAGLVVLTGCQSLEESASNATGSFPGNYNTTAYAPKNPGAVKVKVSLQNSMIYVEEGDKPLLITPCTVGVPDKPTPTGHYAVFEKIKDKRSGSYGFWVNGNVVVPGESGQAPPGAGYHYVGYPMAYWVGFKPEYGFHAGPVWPVGHSHGCIRIHPNVAPKFFALVHSGTPVIIESSLPEDSTVGANVRRPDDYKLPDPPGTYMVSSAVFKSPSGALLVNQ
jgi:L,D-transpeptidase catalytic domain